MSTRKKAAGLAALQNLQASTVDKEVTVAKKPATKRTTQKSKTPKPSTTTTSISSSKSKQDKVIFSLHLPEQAHSQLREMSFHERQSMTQLILEGLDMLFKKRGLSPVAKAPSDK